MKKGLKVTLITVVTIFFILLLLPFAFRGKIKDIVIAQGNKMLNAEFNMETLNISLVRNFPRATVVIRDFNLWGVDEFAQDTLLSADKLSATVNLASLFSDSGYEISKIELVGVDAKAIVLESGKANWDIMKSSDEPEVDEDIDVDDDFKINLNKVIFGKVNLSYDDRQSNMYASVKDLLLVMSGNMSADHTTLNLKTDIESLTFRNGGIALLNEVKVAADMKVDADLKNQKFVLQDNHLSLNAIKASVDGSFAILDDGMDLDMKLNTEKVGFKEILSMIPAIYAKDFKSLKADGDVELDAWVKGRMQGDDLPAFDASLKVSNGSFRYPSLPKGVDNIHITASAKGPGGKADLVRVDVNPMTFTMAGNPFSAVLHLANPISDPTFEIKAKGKLDLGMVEEVYPMDDMDLSGIFNADLDLKGRMSYIEKEQYDRFLASGTLSIKDMIVKLKDMPDLDIKQSTFTFTPQYLKLSETTVNIGSSDITADSRFENYMAFLSKGQLVRGTLNVRSNNLDLNEIMGIEPQEDAKVEESSEMKAIKVPENINFNMTTSLKKVIFDNLTLDNVDGKIVINAGKLDMSNLSFNTLGGGIVANGYYSTAAGIERPKVNAAFKMNQLSFAETFNTFVTVQKLAPIFENLKGDFSGNVSIDMQLDSLMNPQYPTMNGAGGISTKDLNLSGVPVFDKIAEVTKYDKLKNINVKDINIDFTIKEGRVHTQPFDLKMGDVNLNLSGSTGIDETIDYLGKVQLPASTGIGKYTSVDLKIGGTFASPKVSLDAKGMAEQAVKTVATEALDKVGEKLGINISDVEGQRATMIEQAEKAGEKLVKEAEKQAAKLVQEAGENKLAKFAAEKAGEKLVEQAQKQSDNLVKKATDEGDKLLERAKKGEEQ